jgi:hypothetical protein
MYFLKIILASMLVGSLDQTIPDENGWVSVERPETVQEEFQEAENGIWVVFSKNFEGEKFQVRFPEDPSYQAEENGILLHAGQGANDFFLRVEKRGDQDSQSLFAETVHQIQSSPESFLLKAEESERGIDLFYRRGENWVWERIYFSSKLTYTFQTTSTEMSGHPHRQFVSSLDIL